MPRVPRSWRPSTPFAGSTAGRPPACRARPRRLARSRRSRPHPDGLGTFARWPRQGNPQPVQPAAMSSAAPPGLKQALVSRPTSQRRPAAPRRPPGCRRGSPPPRGPGSHPADGEQGGPGGLGHEAPCSHGPSAAQGLNAAGDLAGQGAFHLVQAARGGGGRGSAHGVGTRDGRAGAARQMMPRRIRPVRPGRKGPALGQQRWASPRAHGSTPGSGGAGGAHPGRASLGPEDENGAGQGHRHPAEQDGLPRPAGEHLPADQRPAPRATTRAWRIEYPEGIARGE